MDYGGDSEGEMSSIALQVKQFFPVKCGTRLNRVRFPTGRAHRPCAMRCDADHHQTSEVGCAKNTAALANVHLLRQPIHN